MVAVTAIANMLGVDAFAPRQRLMNAPGIRRVPADTIPHAALHSAGVSLHLSYLDTLTSNVQEQTLDFAAPRSTSNIVPSSTGSGSSAIHSSTADLAVKFGILDAIFSGKIKTGAPKSYQKAWSTDLRKTIIDSYHQSHGGVAGVADDYEYSIDAVHELCDDGGSGGALSQAISSYIFGTGASAPPDDSFLSATNDLFDTDEGREALANVVAAYRQSSGASAMPDDSFLSAIREISDNSAAALATAVAAYREAGGPTATPDDYFLEAIDEVFGADPSLTALANAVGAYRQATGASATPDDDWYDADNDFLEFNNESYDNGVGNGASIGAASTYKTSNGATAMPDDSFLSALGSEIGGDNGNIKALAAAVAAYRQAGGASAIPDDSFLGAMNEIGDKSGNSGALAAAAAAYRGGTGVGKPTGEGGVGISSYLDSISSSAASTDPTSASAPTDKSLNVASPYRGCEGATQIPDDYYIDALLEYCDADASSSSCAEVISSYWSKFGREFFLTSPSIPRTYDSM